MTAEILDFEAARLARKDAMVDGLMAEVAPEIDEIISAIMASSDEKCIEFVKYMLAMKQKPPPATTTAGNNTTR